MPTARELLDQADALMRRNRLSAAPAAEPDDGIPMLTEAVAPPPGDLRGIASPPAPASITLDDVPLLTDAVEEIEAPSILEEPPDIEEPPELDDPAAWTDTLTGAHSILGDNQIELPPRVPASELTSAAPPASVSPFPSGVVERSAEWDEAVAPYQASVPVVESIDVEALPPDEAATDAPTGFDDRDFDALPRDDIAEPPPVQHDDAPVTHADVSSHAHAVLEPYDMGADATLPGVAAAVVPAAAPAPPEDDARWSALAEEIRMQVLQRIDLFTDTGLREQLAAHLRPIVDRASADLVATINQHVGMLLRAYVAEAIEREIERWRADRP